MPVVITQHDHYLLYTLRGDILEFDELIRLFRQALSDCRDKDLPVMIQRSEIPDININRVTLKNFLKISESLAAGNFRTFRCALVFDNPILFDDMEFFVNAAAARGVRIRLFDTFAAAEQWLLQ